MLDEMLQKSTEQKTPISKEMPLQIKILQMINAYRLSQAISVAAKLGIADLLKDGAKSIDSLTKTTKTHPPSLYRLLRALASVGIFAEKEKGYFELTPLAVLLQTDSSNSVKDAAIMAGDNWHWSLWQYLSESVTTGDTAVKHIADGSNLFEYFERYPKAGMVFDKAMTSNSEMLDRAIAAAYDFSKFQCLVDIGGGQGSLLATVLKRYPNLRGVLFDRITVIEKVKVNQTFDAPGLASRCELIVGDFFKTVPSGGNVYILKTVIHDWDDEDSISILKNCRNVMPENGKLLLAEMVVSEGNAPTFAKFLDLEMLVMTGGRERTETEYQKLLKAGGFQLTQVVPTKSPISLIEAIPI